MTTFDAALHPRGRAQNAGQFRIKENEAPGAGLEGRSFVEMQAERIQELEDHWFALWTDTEPNAELDLVGEDPGRQADLARTTTDPRTLAQLARNTVGDVGSAVARNPHTPAGVLHYLATSQDRARAYEDRFHAIHNVACDPATIRALWDAPLNSDWCRPLRIDMATAPNTPGDILRDLAFRSYSPQAGDHPNFPEEALAAAVSDPTRAHLVVGNAKLTDEQLRAALRAVDPFTDDDDDEIWAVLTAAGAAKHPNASEETVKSLLTHPDAHVRKTAKDRLTGNRITRSRAAAEREMRDAGGSEEEITLAGNIAARGALEGKEWGQA